MKNIVVMIPNSWMVGEPGDPHHPEVQKIISAFETIGYTFTDYGDTWGCDFEEEEMVELWFSLDECAAGKGRSKQA